MTRAKLFSNCSKNYLFFPRQISCTLLMMLFFSCLVFNQAILQPHFNNKFNNLVCHVIIQRQKRKDQDIKISEYI